MEGDRTGAGAIPSDVDAAQSRAMPADAAEEIAETFDEDRVLEQVDRKAGHRLVAHLDEDERIQAEVARALAADELTAKCEIDVRVDAGAVNLRGTVESRTIRRRAEDVAEAVRGVSYVQNDLRARDPYFHAADREAPPGIHTGHDPA
jgi:osmotically-inducible protein OsmY